MCCIHQIDEWVQERRNSIANALEFCLSWTNPSKSGHDILHNSWVLAKLLRSPICWNDLHTTRWVCIKQLNLFINTFRPRQDGRHFPDDIFNYIFLNENAWISIKISLKFVPKGPVNNIPSSVQIMAPIKRQAIIWTNDGLVYWHIYVTWPQLVKSNVRWDSYTPQLPREDPCHFDHPVPPQSSHKDTKPDPQDTGDLSNDIILVLTWYISVSFSNPWSRLI